MHYSTLAATALLSLAQAVDVQVVYVGFNPANNVTAAKFWPEKIDAPAGTMVQFQFWAGNHTATQSTFDAPCQPISQTLSNVTTIDSSYQPADADSDSIPAFTVQVTDASKPMWFYCAQGPHCANGMAMVINQQDETKSLEAYKEVAAGSAGGDAGAGGDADAGSGSGDGADNGTGSDDGLLVEEPSSGDDGLIGEDPSSGTPSSDDGLGDSPDLIGDNPASDDESNAGEDVVPAAGNHLALPSTLLLAAGIAFALF